MDPRYSATKNMAGAYTNASDAKEAESLFAHAQPLTTRSCLYVWQASEATEGRSATLRLKKL